MGDFAGALRLLSCHDFQAVELSALRIGEVLPLITALPDLALTKYAYISFHAPSSFLEKDEEHLVDLLSQVPESWPIILHPDTIFDFDLWKPLEDRIAIENMDHRKSTGRSVRELHEVFNRLPRAKMCLDLGHARQVDSSMIEAYLLLKTFSDRIVQLHVSEVDTRSRHDIISKAAELAFRQLRTYIPSSVAVIVESRVLADQIDEEARKVANFMR